MCFALYLELVEGLDPCPLWPLQRACMALGGGFALIASLHNPGRIGFLGYASSKFFFQLVERSQVGNLFAKSAERFGSPCGPDLSYLPRYSRFSSSAHDYLQ